MQSKLVANASSGTILVSSICKPRESLDAVTESTTVSFWSVSTTPATRVTQPMITTTTTVTTMTAMVTTMTVMVTTTTAMVTVMTILSMRRSAEEPREEKERINSAMARTSTWRLTKEATRKTADAAGWRPSNRHSNSNSRITMLMETRTTGSSRTLGATDGA